MYRHKLLAQNVDKIGCWSPDATVLTRFKPLKYSFMILRHYFGSSEWVRILRPGMPQIAMQHSRWAKAKLPVHIPVQARGQGLQRLPNWPRWSDKEVVLNQGGRIRKSRDRGQRIWTLWIWLSHWWGYAPIAWSNTIFKARMWCTQWLRFLLFYYT